MPPPSSTMRSPSSRAGSSRRRPVMDAIAVPTRSSSGQLSYFAQPLNAQFSEHDFACRRRWTPVGAESRSHTRSVGTTWKRIRSSRAACAVEHLAADSTISSDWQRISTGSCIGEDARDLGVDPRNRTEFAGPVRLVMRPGDPGRAVRLPLRRHTELCARVAHAPRYRFRIGPYASTRRSRRNGQLRRTVSMSAGSHCAMSTSSPSPASAT